jgi:hypothetical protein
MHNSKISTTKLLLVAGFGTYQMGVCETNIKDNWLLILTEDKKQIINFMIGKEDLLVFVRYLREKVNEMIKDFDRAINMEVTGMSLISNKIRSNFGGLWLMILAVRIGRNSLVEIQFISEDNKQIKYWVQLSIEDASVMHDEMMRSL